MMMSSNGNIFHVTGPLCVRVIHWSLVDSPHKIQWYRALVLSLICAWTRNLTNNWDFGDLRCHRAHYDVTVMWYLYHVCRTEHKSCHNISLVFTGGCGGCLHDILQCCQWLQSWQYDNSAASDNKVGIMTTLIFQCSFLLGSYFQYQLAYLYEIHLNYAQFHYHDFTKKNYFHNFLMTQKVQRASGSLLIEWFA